MSFNKRQLVLRGLRATGGLRLLEAAHAWQGLLVLNYHRIGIPGESLFDRALWSATEDDFDQQVRILKQNCEIIGLDDLPTVERALQTDGRRTRFGMITFDDGYLDNFEVAFPVLQSNDAPGVFFVTTGFLDESPLAWWDEISWMVRTSTCTSITAGDWPDMPVSVDLSDCDQASRTLIQILYGLNGNRTSEFLDYLADVTGTGRAPANLSTDLWMNWSHVRDMRAAGMSIGAHSVTHPVLSRLTPEQQSFEICESKLRVEQELGEPVTAFSYPVGRRDAFNQETRTALTHHGIDWAFSYYGGFLQSRTGSLIDRLDIPRVAVESDTTLAEFRSFTVLPQLFSRH